jgi:TAG lipase/steryl ester hydrolase/phospholipase A2/LPA acyltransferase
MERKITKFCEKLVNILIQNLPTLEKLTLSGLDVAFGPKQVLYHLCLAAALHTTLIGINGIGNVLEYVVALCSKKGWKRLELMEKMKKAMSYAEWEALARDYDEIQNNIAWRLQDESPLYDASVIQKRTDDLVDMIKKGDVFNLMFRLRGALARDQFGMQHEGLYSQALSGTKLIVEKYHGTVVKALNFVCDSPISDDEVPTDAKLAFFNETRHAYGRTALLLSGGAYLGFYSIGVMKALLHAGLLPRVISGSSAGSLVAGMIKCIYTCISVKIWMFR